VRPEPIDSTKKLLDPPEILIEFLKRYDDTGNPIQVSMIAIAHELSMDTAESIQFGNTVFISHYLDDFKKVYMRALNVDTAENYLDNVENYIAHILRRGIQGLFVNYKDPALSTLIKKVQKRIQKNNPQLKPFKIEFSQEDDQYIAEVNFRGE